MYRGSSQNEDMGKNHLMPKTSGIAIYTKILHFRIFVYCRLIFTQMAAPVLHLSGDQTLLILPR